MVSVINVSSFAGNPVVCTQKNNLRLQICLLEIRCIETQLREILLTKLHPVNTAHQNTDSTRYSWVVYCPDSCFSLLSRGGVWKHVLHFLGETGHFVNIKFAENWTFSIYNLQCNKIKINYELKVLNPCSVGLLVINSCFYNSF